MLPSFFSILSRLVKPGPSRIAMTQRAQQLQQRFQPQSESDSESEQDKLEIPNLRGSKVQSLLVKALTTQHLHALDQILTPQLAGLDTLIRLRSGIQGNLVLEFLFSQRDALRTRFLVFVALLTATLSALILVITSSIYSFLVCIIGAGVSLVTWGRQVMTDMRVYQDAVDGRMNTMLDWIIPRRWFVPSSLDSPAARALLSRTRGGVRYGNGCSMTALHLAVVLDKPMVVEWLLSRGASPTISDSQGLRAIDLARRCGSLPITVLIKEYTWQRRKVAFLLRLRGIGLLAELLRDLPDSVFEYIVTMI
eukprot:gb/GEZN01012788.1/.p1 GENE.gb/GEZN01012788.1/~~gb/GEZN01012788.1/.p1  ORF type:complete len:308 (+),score=25.91 gb/GEZN01012788.1/:97-1020(+)